MEFINIIKNMFQGKQEQEQEIKKKRSKCFVCDNTRISYWGNFEGKTYGACLECSSNLAGLIPTYNEHNVTIKELAQFYSAAKKIRDIAENVKIDYKNNYEKYAIKIIELCDGKIYKPSCPNSMLANRTYNENYEILNKIWKSEKYIDACPKFKYISIKFKDGYQNLDLYKKIKNSYFINKTEIVVRTNYDDNEFIFPVELNNYTLHEECCLNNTRIFRETSYDKMYPHLINFSDIVPPGDCPCITKQKNVGYMKHGIFGINGVNNNDTWIYNEKENSFVREKCIYNC